MYFFSKHEVPCLFTALIFLTKLNCILCKSWSDSFTEELFLKPLQNGYIYSHFQFTTHWDVDLSDKKEDQHYRLFPKSLGEVLTTYKVQELHLSLTQGNWQYEKWGYPINDAPSGAELWVWFRHDVHDVDDTWTNLVNVLSGLFCASLNFMDLKITVIPKYSYNPHGATSDRFNPRRTKNVKYAALPGEIVCTENLTPWKKLLPCSGQSGLASLLNPLKLYDSSYNSLSVMYRPICKEVEPCIDPSVELSQSFSAVFEPGKDNRNQKQDWSFKSLFGRTIGASCPLADSSKVYIDVTSNKNDDFDLIPSQSYDTQRNNSHGVASYAVFDVPQQIKSHVVLNVEARYLSTIHYITPEKPSVYINRFQTGYGQEAGGISCFLYNHHTENIVVSYMEVLPWFLSVYFHTLNITSYSNLNIESPGIKITPAKINFIPGRARERSYLMELLFKLPASSLTELKFNFDFNLLKWTEYPPDPMHGFYINSAVITTVIPKGIDDTSTSRSSSHISSLISNEKPSRFLRIHTKSILITLPVPDFSMPYNVICLACTVVAIAFGSLHNYTTRRFVIIDAKRKQGLSAKLKNFFQKVKSEIFKGNEKEESSSDLRESDNPDISSNTLSTDDMQSQSNDT